MQQPSSSHREVRIGLTQAFAWLGFLGALVVLSFFLGLYIGKKSGFEAAKETSLEELARSPIDAPTGNDVGVIGDANSQNQNSSDSIYQKLQATAPTAQPTNAELPTLGKIAGVKDSPIELTVPSDKAAKTVMDVASTAAAIVGGSAGNQLNKKAENIAKAIVDGKEINVGGNDDSQKIQFASPTPIVQNEPVKEGIIAPTVVPTIAATPVATPTTIAELVAPVVETLATPAPTAAVKASPTPKGTPKATPTKIKSTPTPKPTVAAKTEESSSAKSISKGWYAQVAAPQKMAEAQEIINKLSASGFKAKIERAEVKGEQYYRVIVGPEKTKDAANKLAQDLRGAGAVGGTPFVKQVK
jgi:cell division septation protein DedD